MPAQVCVCNPASFHQKRSEEGTRPSDDVRSNILKGRANFIRLRAEFTYGRLFEAFRDASPCPGPFHMPPADSETHASGSCHVSLRSSADICTDAATRYLCPKCFLCPLPLWEEVKTRQRYLFVKVAAHTRAEQAADSGSCDFTTFWYNLGFFYFHCR